MPTDSNVERSVSGIAEDRPQARPGMTVKAEPRNLRGKLLFGSLFVLVLPLVLVIWAALLDRSVQWPVPDWPVFALAVIGAGGLLMLNAMIELSVQGRGLPMSAYPPRTLVTGGPYRLFRHPIYVGAALLAFGSSVLAGSSSGVYIVTPLLIAAMTAYVTGFEQPALDQRFGAAMHDYQPLIGLPSPSDRRPPWGSKLALAGMLAGTWLLVGYLIDAAQCRQTCGGAFVPLLDRERSLHWSLLLWGAPYLALVVRLLASGTATGLRQATVASFGAVLAGSYLYGVLPGLGLDLRGGGLPLVLAGLAACLLGLGYRSIWEALRRLSERVANSRRDLLLFDGRFRIISHAIFAGLAGGAGIGVGGFVLGNGMAALMMSVFFVVGAALFAQVLWASKSLLRPFGYWGAVLGSAMGVFAVRLVFDLNPATVALACTLAAPFIQAIGRLRCLAQGCCHGVETGPELGIRVWQSQSRVVVLSGLKGRYILATQLYSILFNCILGFLLLSLYVAGGVDTTLIIGLYLILTGIERFAEDAYRGEKQTRWQGPLRENQWIAIAAIVAGMGTTLIDSSPPSTPDGLSVPLLVVAMAIGGLFAAFAMSMDFPKSNVRYSRLSG